jgi:hypothetical protein
MEMFVTYSRDDETESFERDPELQARRLVEMGLTEPWAAELHLEFERRRCGRDLAHCFNEPERNPPPDFV